MWLSARTGRFYRLPTEAEWEYACKAGTETAYHFGDEAEKLPEYSWHLNNSFFQYQPVGQKPANPFNLYDMHGNVWEWTLDQFVPPPASAPAQKRVNPLALPTSLYPRVVKGGSWDDGRKIIVPLHAWHPRNHGSNKTHKYRKVFGIILMPSLLASDWSVQEKFLRLMTLRSTGLLRRKY